jgi:hypothetical protein
MALSPSLNLSVVLAPLFWDNPSVHMLNPVLTCNVLYYLQTMVDTPPMKKVGKDTNFLSTSTFSILIDIRSKHSSVDMQNLYADEHVFSRNTITTERVLETIHRSQSR